MDQQLSVAEDLQLRFDLVDDCIQFIVSLTFAVSFGKLRMDQISSNSHLHES